MSKIFYGDDEVNFTAILCDRETFGGRGGIDARP